MSQVATLQSSQTESACIATSQHNVTPIRDMKLMSRYKSVDLTGVLSCSATLFECLGHNLLRLRQVSSM